MPLQRFEQAGDIVRHPLYLRLFAELSTQGPASRTAWTPDDIADEFVRQKVNKVNAARDLSLPPDFPQRFLYYVAELSHPPDTTQGASLRQIRERLQCNPGDVEQLRQRFEDEGLLEHTSLPEDTLLRFVFQEIHECVHAMYLALVE
jgi:hypothetical protein